MAPSRLTPERKKSLRACWTGKSLAELTEFLADYHHARAKAAILPIAGHIDGACTAAKEEAKGTAVSLKHLRGMLTENLLRHSQAEEDTLFPYIRELEKGTTSGRTLRSMDHIQNVHDQIVDTLVGLKLENTLCRLQSASCGRCQLLYGLLAALHDELLEHTFLEDEILFPRALQLEKKQSERIFGQRKRA